MDPMDLPILHAWRDANNFAWKCMGPMGQGLAYFAWKFTRLHSLAKPPAVLVSRLPQLGVQRRLRQVGVLRPDLGQHRLISLDCRRGAKTHRVFIWVWVLRSLVLGRGVTGFLVTATEVGRRGWAGPHGHPT